MQVQRFCRGVPRQHVNCNAQMSRQLLLRSRPVPSSYVLHPAKRLIDALAPLRHRKRASIKEGDQLARTETTALVKAFQSLISPVNVTIDLVRLPRNRSGYLAALVINGLNRVKIGHRFCSSAFASFAAASSSTPCAIASTTSFAIRFEAPSKKASILMAVSNTSSRCRPRMFLPSNLYC